MPIHPALYASPIQHVLVLQEEDEPVSDLRARVEPAPNSASNNPSDADPSSWGSPERQRPPPSSSLSTPPARSALSPRRDGLSRPGTVYPWRVRDRMKTANGALVLCLNIGVDPPDVVKPSPCARLECWTEPNVENPPKSLQQIANALKAQYERWQLKARYKVAKDPTVAELKRHCVTLRRTAKQERVLFHYNGHGVPKPTSNGEIWVFNHNFTQYIPMNLLDLHEVLGSPSLYVFDCNSAGTIYYHFQKLMEHLDREWEEANRKSETDLPPPSHRNSILLGACRENELLPTSPHLPADLFTSCLTTPIKTVLRWFANRTLVTGVTPELIDRLPGNLNIRQTPLGELNWIFTAVTDAIAWNVLPRDKFKMLYRQDLLLASLMRNFLLADRIMRTYGCRPVSQPALPETHTHPLWQAFDRAMEQVLCQLPFLVATEEARLKTAQMQEEDAQALNREAQPNGQAQGFTAAGDDAISSNAVQRQFATLSTPSRLSRSSDDPGSSSDLQAMRLAIGDCSYIASTFFEDQMKAFDVWLNMGPDQRAPPEQLPIMLQVLLSPVFRVKALPLLSRYLQTGPVAVDLALSVGIFPYVLRLLQSQSKDMRQELVFIWSKILALDDTCGDDLIKEKGEEYFVRFLTPHPGRPEEDPKPVYLAVAMFVLSVLGKDYADRCRDVGTLEACYSRLTHTSPFVRRWACLCLTSVIRNASPPTQSQALAWVELIQTLRQCATADGSPDVRAAAASALSSIMGGVLKLLSLQDGSEPSSQGSRNEYQPKRPNHESERSREKSSRPSSSTSYVHSRQEPRGSASTTAAVDESRDTFFLSEEDFLDAPVPEYSADERDALLKVGIVLSEISRRESSVLIRREIAIAIARAVRYQHERFVRAAHITDVIGKDDTRGPQPATDIDRCELVYRKLWTALSELAFDPHPVVAALARRSYDMVSETLLERTCPGRNSPQSVSSEEIPPTDDVFSPENSSETDFLTSDPSSLTRYEQGRPRSTAPGSFKEVAGESWAKQGTSAVQGGVSEGTLGREDASPSREARSTNSGFPPLGGGTGVRQSTGLPNRPGRAKRRPGPTRPVDPHVPRGSIHVTSSSGSFELNASSRLPLLSTSTMPRVNSASLIPPLAEGSNAKGLPVAAASHDITASGVGGNTDEGGRVVEHEGPRSLPHIALAKGVGILVKTVTQQLTLAGRGSSSNALPRSLGSNCSSGDCKEDKEEREVKPLSPPRPPKRSLSYQVLNASTALSPNGELPIFASSRSTYFAAGAVSASEDSLEKFSKKLPRGYDRLYLSGAGDAALSLYEWSSAYIARVAFDATTTDSVNEEEPIPRYAALWDKFMKSSGNIPSEGLRAFALLGKEENKMSVGSITDDDSNFESALEISSYAMGAGGGAVIAMAFLPRDIGMGDDQLIATGDSTGSVGVFDIRSGSCQGSFGIPFPPGIPEVGVSSILCLNRPSPNMSESSGSLANSRSALILAGAYDGRVAVFKSDLQGPKYRIMSTFQASGQSYWSKVGTSREPAQRPSQHNMMQGTQTSSESSESLHSCPVTFADTVRDSGNGLVLAFDSQSSLLSAAGCDSEVVRIWDLQREQCVWEGAGVAEGTWPTAVTMWGHINPNVFVVGSSEGMITMIDMRERRFLGKRANSWLNIGRLKEPIISLGTCPPVGSYANEVVVSADIGGGIAFWDPRWSSSRDSSSTGSNPEVSRIRAHRSNLTAMAVHPAGTLVASGSTARCVKVFGPNRNMLKMLCSHETRYGFSGVDSRIPPVTSLSFQPESNLLGIGCMDSSVIIYGQPDVFSGVQAHVDEMAETEQVYDY